MKAYVLSDVAGRGVAAFERLLESVAPHAPELFQVREKSATDRAVLEWTRRARSVLPAATRVLVSGRPDIAVAAGADGVQLPSDGLPAADVRRAFPAPFLLGVSVHSLPELARAARDGADFALLAPVYDPLSKPAEREPLGPDALDALPGDTLPVFVLGGITLERLRGWPRARLSRVAGAAGIDLFHRDPAAVAALRDLGAESSGAPTGGPR